VSAVVAQPVEAGGAPEPAANPLDTAVEAYIYGYPLVTTEMTRRVMTNAARPEGTHAPMGQFTAPNADTLYSLAWLDLSQEPWILQVPDEHGRYYLMPMLDAWTDVFTDPGTRTTGTGAGEFAIVGPRWRGELPAGVEELRAPTNLVWVLGRTYCTGAPEDYAAVHACLHRTVINVDDDMLPPARTARRVVACIEPLHTLAAAEGGDERPAAIRSPQSPQSGEADERPDIAKSTRLIQSRPSN
jgi:hypothetical protein